MCTTRLRVVMKCFLPALVFSCPPGAHQCVRTILCSLLGILLLGSSCLGEETRDDREGPVSREVRQVEPDLYYVEDDLGRLIPVPGFRYRDFVDLVRLRDGLPVQAESPGVVLEQLRMKVTLPAPTGSNVTHADVDVECVVRSTRSGWGVLPLKLPELVLAESPAVVGNGEVVVTIDPSPVETNTDSSANQSLVQQGVFESRAVLDKGFLVWIHEQDEVAETEPGKRRKGGRLHTIVLRGQIPVDVSLDRDQLSFTLPAATDSKISIETKRRDPLVKLNAGVIRLPYN